MRTLLITGLFAAALPAQALADAASEAREALGKTRAQIAAWEAARSRGRGDLDALTKDPRPEIRREAVRALGRLQDADAEAALVEALADAEPVVRAEAAFALGQLPGEGVAPLVARWPTETDPAVRGRLLEAIGKRASPVEADALLEPAAGADPALRARARTGLALVARRAEGQTAVPMATLATWLADPDARGRRGAAYLLQRAKGLVGDDARAAAETCAEDADAVVRLRCVAALSRFGAPAHATLQRAATEDADWRVRAAGVNGLKTHAPGLAAVLTVAAARLAADPARLARADVQPTLAALDAARALPGDRTAALTGAAEALWSATKGVRAPAPVAFGARHVQCRAAALLDRGTPKRLKRCGGDALPALLTETWTADVLAAGTPKRRLARLERFFESAQSPGKVAALGHVFAEAAVAARAAQPGKRGDAARQTALAMLAAALGSSDPAVVGAGAEIVARLKRADFEDHLLEAYRRMMAADQLEAVLSLFDAMAAIRSKRAVAVLEQHTTHAHPAISGAAKAALGRIVGGAKMHHAGLPPAMGLADDAPPAKSLGEPSKWRRAVLHTTKGPIELRLLRDEARATVKNFTGLAEKGFFDGKALHRVVPGFVVQGGDPRGDGWGGPGYTIPCEINGEPFSTGAVGMALAGKDTGGSQFFVTHAPHPHLDGGYTVFARVTDGQATADALLIGDRIERVTLKRD